MACSGCGALSLKVPASRQSNIRLRSLKFNTKAPVLSEVVDFITDDRQEKVLKISIILRLGIAVSFSRNGRECFLTQSRLLDVNRSTKVTKLSFILFISALFLKEFFHAAIPMNLKCHVVSKSYWELF